MRWGPAAENWRPGEWLGPMFEQAFRNIDDVLRKEAGCTTELDYTEQTSWLLFLKYLDDLEQDKQTEVRPEGRKCRTLSSETQADSPVPIELR